MTSNRSGFISAARGNEPADIVFTGAEIFNPFTCAWERGDLAVRDGVILGTGDYHGIRERSLDGAYIVPGLIDAHVHIESSLLLPREYARLVARHGTATVIADPHEIANVAGIPGIEFMLAERHALPVDIRYMFPSCVPATPRDIGGAVLTTGSMAQFSGRDGITGLGEMMNVPGVLAEDPEVLRKIAVFPIRDGHAPLLSGKDLNAYILAGLQSDHECTRAIEAEEKLSKGMYVYLREGATARNIEELATLVTPFTVARCCFATDDCPADLLLDDGHIDRCIRRAVSCGMAPELAIRMATLSAAERFGLTDRGALTPGSRADFCVIDDPERFVVKEVFSGGQEPDLRSKGAPDTFPSSFRCDLPQEQSIRIGGRGNARVIRLVPHQILTGSAGAIVEGTALPDTSRDILKVVVCNRYGTGAIGVGLVQGFKFSRGAIASSVAHDAHNLISAGTSDPEIIAAIGEVIRMQGGMAAVVGTEKACLPLDCAGLMSTLPYEEVIDRIRALNTLTGRMGGIADPFMYLSFLSLTVIPELRVTDRGVFDVTAFADVPLFSG